MWGVPKVSRLQSAEAQEVRRSSYPFDSSPQYGPMQSTINNRYLSRGRGLSRSISKSQLCLRSLLAEIDPWSERGRKYLSAWSTYQALLQRFYLRPHATPALCSFPDLAASCAFCLLKRSRTPACTSCYPIQPIPGP